MFLTDEYIRLSRQIVQVAPVTRIFLLGTRQVTCHTVSIFSSDALPGESTTHYFLLVLIRRNREASNNSVQDRIETVCAAITQVTAFVIDFAQFNHWLQEGHGFACQVRTKARLLFEDLGMPFSDAREIDPDAIKKSRDAAYLHGVAMVEEFLAGADLYRGRQQNKMAALMLHQAAETALHAILKITIGLTMNSHNLDRLTRYCSLSVPRVAEVFKKQLEPENRLFHLLQRAYIETRYKETYSISTPDLLEITGKIRLLQEILFSLA